MTESNLGQAYKKIYASLCGGGLILRPWHFQWLSRYWLNRSLCKMLPVIGQTEAVKILDVGCGDKPYRSWFGPNVTQYIGIDIFQGKVVDVVVSETMCFPFQDQSFDVVFSTQSIEHMKQPDLTLKEMDRVLKMGGKLILSMPFLYNEHGSPHDFRRLTRFGAVQLYPNYIVSFLEEQGGIGSTLVILALNWIEDTLNLHRATRLIKAIMLPLWIALSFILNIFGLLLDKLDRTKKFYSNVLLIFEKK